MIACCYVMMSDSCTVGGWCDGMLLGRFSSRESNQVREEEEERVFKSVPNLNYMASPTPPPIFNPSRSISFLCASFFRCPLPSTFTRGCKRDKRGGTHIFHPKLLLPSSPVVVHTTFFSPFTFAPLPHPLLSNKSSHKVTFFLSYCCIL